MQIIVRPSEKTNIDPLLKQKPKKLKKFEHHLIKIE